MTILKKKWNITSILKIFLKSKILLCIKFAAATLTPVFFDKTKLESLVNVVACRYLLSKRVKFHLSYPSVWVRFSQLRRKVKGLLLSFWVEKILLKRTLRPLHSPEGFSFITLWPFWNGNIENILRSIRIIMLSLACLFNKYCAWENLRYSSVCAPGKSRLIVKSI